jgi:2-(1,2-epoxy-1,2-dihydrophenyl)acetyl-CoA isomerase
MTDEPCINLIEEGAVVRLVLNNPPRRNAFTHAMRDDLIAKMEALNGNPDVRAVVLTGEGKHFCVGADISAGGKRPDTRLEMREAMKVVQRLYHVVATAPKPYVAAVGGDAFGSGMSLALACDFIVGGPDARFGTAFARLGGYPELAMASTLGRRVGEARAKRLLMLCEHVHAQQALAMGLIDELAEEDHVEAAMALAQSLAAAAPLSLAYIKSTFVDGTPSPAEAIRMELDSATTLMGVTEDSREGIAAFREKRTPKFTGR